MIYNLALITSLNFHFHRSSVNFVWIENPANFFGRLKRKAGKEFITIPE